MSLEKEEIQINQRTPGVTLSDGVANVDSEVVSYPVPTNSAIKLRPTDFIGLYLADSTPAELAATSLVTVLMCDAWGRKTTVIAQGEYAQFKELTDALKKYFIKGKRILKSNWLFKIKVLAATAADDAQTRFTVSGELAYETLE